MARQNINTGTTANDGTGDTLRQAGNKINGNFIEIYTLLGGDSAAITQKVSLSDSGVTFTGNTYNSVLGWIEGNERVVVQLPDSEGTLITNTAAQTLTNKTLTSAVLTTPQINDTSADHQYIFAPSELAADRTITLPLLTSDDTFVFRTHTQTLTNKTLTTPTIARPIIQGHINDSNGAEMIKFSTAASAINEILITNAAAGGIPQVAVAGDEANISLGLSSIGTGLIHIQTGMRYRSETISADGAINQTNRALTVFTSGSLINATMPDGTSVGEYKILANDGTADVRISFSSGKFENADSNNGKLVLRQNGVAQILWVNNTTGWHLLGVDKPLDYTDAAALFYVS